MGKRLYIGNLSYNTTQDGLRAEFAKYGKVVDAKLITDRETGRSRGFGFIEYDTEQEAQAVVASMNGASFEGRSLTVNIAEDRPPRGGGGGRSFGGGGGGGNRNYGGPPPQDFGGGGGHRGGKRGGGSRRRRDDSDWG